MPMVKGRAWSNVDLNSVIIRVQSSVSFGTVASRGLLGPLSNTYTYFFKIVAHGASNIECMYHLFFL